MLLVFKSLNFKASLLSVAVLVTLSSCGKSKELKANGPAEKPQTSTQAPSTPAPATQAPADASTKTPAAPAAPAVSVPAALPTSNQLTPETSGTVTATPSAPAASSAAPSAPAVTLPSSPSATTPVDSAASASSGSHKKNNLKNLLDIDFANQLAIKTGAQQQGLFYTSAGSDGLMTEFRSYEYKLPADLQKANIDLAKSIVSAKLFKVGQSTFAQVVVNEAAVDSVKPVLKKYLFKAKQLSHASGYFSNLVSVTQPENGILSFQGGYIKCLDLSDSCQDAYIKVKLSGAEARIIFRKSYADTHFIIQDKKLTSPGFNLMKRYVLNRVMNAETQQKIEAVVVSSYEVVNGKSEMGAMILTSDKQMVGLKIPLVVSSVNSEVDASVAKVSDLSKEFNLNIDSTVYSQRLSQQINDVQLIKNNGLGQLKLKMNFGYADTSASIWMVLAKVHKATMSIQDVRAFESALK